jgi:hypothetical protein
MEARMSITDKLSHMTGRRDQVPNQELAKELVRTNNRNGIREIVQNLSSDDRNRQSDCIKVLYEIGYLRPELIADYAEDFLKLLRHRNNRMVWGGMTALSTIAGLIPEKIFTHLDSVLKMLESGSVITVDGAVKTLSATAASKTAYNRKIFPLLLGHLQYCRPKQVAMHAGFIASAVNKRNRDEFLSLLKERAGGLNAVQQKRIAKIIKKVSTG